MHAFVFADLRCLSRVAANEFELATAPETVIVVVVDFGFDYFDGGCVVAVTQDLARQFSHSNTLECIHLFPKLFIMASPSSDTYGAFFIQTMII